jgi:hypothetical protein
MSAKPQNTSTSSENKRSIHPQPKKRSARGGWIAVLLVVVGIGVGIVIVAGRLSDSSTDDADVQHDRQTATALAYLLLPTAAPTIPLTPSPTPTERNTPLPTSTLTARPTDLPTLTPIPVTDTPDTTYYATTGVNLRLCPWATDECAPQAQLAAGDRVRVTGVAWGESIGASAVWFQVMHRGQSLYAHSSVLSENAPVQAAPIIPTSAPVANTDPFGCNGINDLDCRDFNALGINANAHLAQCGDEDHLDGDGDGRACENW